MGLEQVRRLLKILGYQDFLDPVADRHLAEDYYWGLKQLNYEEHFEQENLLMQDCLCFGGYWVLLVEGLEVVQD